MSTRQNERIKNVYYIKCVLLLIQIVFQITYYVFNFFTFSIIDDSNKIVFIKILCSQQVLLIWKVYYAVTPTVLWETKEDKNLLENKKIKRNKILYYILVIWMCFFVTYWCFCVFFLLYFYFYVRLIRKYILSCTCVRDGFYLMLLCMCFFLKIFLIWNLLLINVYMYYYKTKNR